MGSKQEIRRIVEDFASSGKTRTSVLPGARDFGQQKNNGKLIEVAIEPEQTDRGFALVLANGRRIESSWKFKEAEWLLLIRIAEV